MSKSAIGTIAQILRDEEIYVSEQYVPYNKDGEIIQMCIMDTMVSSEYTSESRINTMDYTINVYSPVDNDRESVYNALVIVQNILEGILNLNYENGVIRHVYDVSQEYKGVTAEKAIVYAITFKVDDEVKL